MSDSVAQIRQRMQLAAAGPEMLDTRNGAAVHWRDDVSTLLTEIEQLSDLLQAANTTGAIISTQLSEAKAEAERLRAELRTCQETLTACLETT
jgi:hypothetical protein